MSVARSDWRGGDSVSSELHGNIDDDALKLIDVLD